MPRIFTNLEAGCLQVTLMSTSSQINQLKYTILYYTILILQSRSHQGFIKSHNNSSILTINIYLNHT